MPLELDSGLKRSSTMLWSFALIVALSVISIIAHGCHSDDIDHEPTIHLETDAARR